jgi:hypothetical protein
MVISTGMMRLIIREGTREDDGAAEWATATLTEVTESMDGKTWNIPILILFR